MNTFTKRLLPKLAISIALGALFAWLAMRGGLPLIPPTEAFRHVAGWAIPAFLGVQLVTQLVRATRWRFLIMPVKRLALRDVIALNWVGFFAIFALPLRLGEVARPALTKLRHGVPLSVGFGTVAVERVSDGLIMSLCVAWALFALPRQPTDDVIAANLPVYGYLALVVFASAFVALAAFLWARSWAIRMTERIFGLFSARMGALVAEKLDGIAEGIRSIREPRLIGGFLMETLLYWTLNGSAMWLLAVGCGLPLEFGHGIAIMGILALGILLPAGPGLFGNFQLAVGSALKLYVAAELVGVQGAVYVFLLYTLQAVVLTTIGVIPLYLMDLSLSELAEVEEA